MDIQKNGFLSIEQLTDRYFSKNQNITENRNSEGLSFQEILQQKSTVKFSKHAAGRLMDRNISLTENQLERLNDGARKAEAKGIKDSLVIVDELAFIVNVPNNTVVTAMDSTETTDNVFTNINGAVIM
uniref:TIGR02530 family flagellar biosynthesis protein n=1 Tax=Acetatifactor sp. TaxID=1872090 RepID=UPI004056BF26